MRNITVYWSRPLTLGGLESFYERNRDKLYAILGKSNRINKYGNHNWKLFYIGQTVQHTSRRIFSENHKYWTIEQQKSARWRLYVRVGEIGLEDGRRLTRTLISEVEAAQIYHHNPLYNQQNTRSYYSRDMMISNVTRKGATTVQGLKAYFKA